MEKINQSKSVFTISGRHRFVASVIIVLLVSCAAFAYLACCYKQAQDDIVALQRKDALVFAASCLMIIFLVFSLYSIFKTDEMLNKAETEARGIHKLLDDAKQTTEIITTQYQIMMTQQKGRGVTPPSPVPPLAHQMNEGQTNDNGGERDEQ